MFEYHDSLCATATNVDRERCVCMSRGSSGSNDSNEQQQHWVHFGVSYGMYLPYLSRIILCERASKKALFTRSERIGASSFHVLHCAINTYEIPFECVGKSVDFVGRSTFGWGKCGFYDIFGVQACTKTYDSTSYGLRLVSATRSY